MDDTMDWIANARQGMSRRQFVAGVGATGVSLAGFAVAATPVAGQIITTPTEGLAVADSKVPAGEFQVPIYEARPAPAGKTAEFIVYPGAPHAFHSDFRPSYRPEAAKDAWSRCVAWFNKYLKA